MSVIDEVLEALKWARNETVNPQAREAYENALAALGQYEVVGEGVENSGSFFTNEWLADYEEQFQRSSYADGDRPAILLAQRNP